MSITGGAWIGITDAAVEGTWIDFDGVAFGSGQGTGFTSAGGRFTNWDYSAGFGQEPNNLNNEDYAGIYTSSGKWVDHSMTDTRKILCQKPLYKSELNRSCLTMKSYLFFQECKTNWISHYYGETHSCWYHAGKY